MSQILSEKEIFSEKGVVWGTWKLSLSEDQINRKMSSLPLPRLDKSSETELWKKIFSNSKSESNIKSSIYDRQPDLDNSVPSPEKELDSPMECSPILTGNIHSKTHQTEAEDTESVIELTSSFIDLCNQAASNLKRGIDFVRVEMSNIIEELNKLSNDSLIKLIGNVWSNLTSDVTRLCFCIPLTSNTELCEHLCKHVLLKWLCKSLPNKVGELSKIFSYQGETICKDLIAPLLQIEDSPFVQDVMNLEDIMSSMSETNWTTLLLTLISNLVDLQAWHLPVLATILERSNPSQDDMNRLINLMSSTGTEFCRNQNFGTLLVEAANCLKHYSSSVTQLKLIANSYNLPLKFKALKVLGNIKE